MNQDSQQSTVQQKTNKHNNNKKHTRLSKKKMKKIRVTVEKHNEINHPTKEWHSQYTTHFDRNLMYMKICHRIAKSFTKHEPNYYNNNKITIFN